MKLISYIILVISVMLNSLSSADEINNKKNVELDRIKKTIENIQKRATESLKPESSEAKYQKKILAIIYNKLESGINKFNIEQDTQISIKIVNTGHLEEIRFDKKSKNNDFNNYIVLSILNLSPFPAFPLGIKKNFTILKIDFLHSRQNNY